jgi:PAS domain S-box-containing protein
LSTPAGTPGLWTPEERWHILIENLRDYAIFMLNPEGVIVTWGVGGERLLGYKEEEILGRNFCEIFTPHDVNKEQPQFELHEAREKGRAEDERWHLRKDGTQFWASGVVTPLWDNTGQLRGFAKVLRDITDRKRAEERLIEDAQRKDEFLAMLSHELRNPLAALANASELLAMEDSASLKETAGIISRQVKSLITLVNDLTDASRINSGKIALHRQNVLLSDVIRGALECAKPGIAAREHQLHVTVPEESVRIDADGNRLQQVVANLLDNAIKYTDPGGQIWLTAEAVGNEAVVKVKDTGGGILSELQTRIFDMFVQADRSLDRVEGGLGIGLSVAKRLVEMHGGRISVTSEGIGHGSEFEVRLPIITGSVAPEAIQPAALSAPKNGLKLVVAEDNQDTATTLGILLKRLGHSVDVVHDGAAALRAVAAAAPDVILLDIGLPTMNGYEVAERLRQQPELERLEIIAMTGYGQEEDIARSKKAGFNHHLVKPVSLVDLAKLLEQIRGTSTANGPAILR